LFLPVQRVVCLRCIFIFSFLFLGQEFDCFIALIIRISCFKMSQNITVDLKSSTCQESIQVLPEVFEIQEEIVQTRRWFHAHPELSFKEFNTAAKIVEYLKSYGIDEIYEKCAGTGVVAVIRGGSPGPCIGLRADIDALPVTETADTSYKSQNEGVMHACGHDGHITGLLTAARIINASRLSMKGSVKLLFQPAEEGYGGAKVMVDEGCLEEGQFGPRVDTVYGIHLWNCKYSYDT
jgi:metal-dependent amidase/aminoacylase/carboxypeptidase family protein